MEQIILEKMRSILLERTSIDSLPESVWKHIAALNTWGTNAIEGSTITRKDAERILLDNKTPAGKPIRDITETLQHEVAFRSLLEKRKRDVTLETVLELHEEVFRIILPNAGQWRRVNVRIHGANFTPPRMEKVRNEIEKWLKIYLERDIEGEDVFTLGAWMHQEFERVHPFSDGNGRVGRLLLNLHFLKRNWPPVHILPIHRDDYLNSLNKFREGDSSKFINFLKILTGSSLIDLLDSVGTSEDELISLIEASDIFPYSEKYLALRCKQGEIPAMKSGREWRVSKRSVKLYQEYVGR